MPSTSMFNICCGLYLNTSAAAWFIGYWQVRHPDTSGQKTMICLGLFIATIGFGMSGHMLGFMLRANSSNVRCHDVNGDHHNEYTTKHISSDRWRRRRHALSRPVSSIHESATPQGYCFWYKRLLLGQVYRGHCGAGEFKLVWTYSVNRVHHGANSLFPGRFSRVD